MGLLILKSRRRENYPSSLSLAPCPLFDHPSGYWFWRSELSWRYFRYCLGAHESPRPLLIVYELSRLPMYTPQKFVNNGLGTNGPSQPQRPSRIHPRDPVLNPHGSPSGSATLSYFASSERSRYTRLPTLRQHLSAVIHCLSAAEPYVRLI